MHFDNFRGNRRGGFLLAGVLLAALSSCDSDNNPPGLHADDDSDQDRGSSTASDDDDDDAVDAGKKPTASKDAATPALDGSAPTKDASSADASSDARATPPQPMMDAARSDAGAPRDASTGTRAAAYTEEGPYAPVKTLLNQGVDTVTTGTTTLVPVDNINDPSGFTLFYPEGGDEDERFPLLTWGNGTFTSPTFYESLINHVVSYGFIVIASNSADVGSGEEMLQAVEWALAQDEDSESPIYGKLDREQIGALGHSQGGSGTVMVGQDERIKAIAALSGVPLQNTEEEVAKIQCPTFYTTTTGDAATPESVQAAYDATLTPAVFGVTNGGDHDEYADVDDDPGGILAFAGLTSNDGKRTRAAIAAWFDWQLKGKGELSALFLGEDCGFCGDSDNWSMFQSKGF